MSALAIAPTPWDWVSVPASASGGFHLYLVDDNDRKIAALWGGHDEKLANAYLIAASHDLYAAGAKVLAGLQARIDAADPAAVPVFDGIAELAAALALARGERT